MNQLTLTPQARTTDPQTSHLAAVSVTGLTESRAAVLRVLREWSEGLTDQVLVEYYRLEETHPRQSESGIRSRRHELVVLGLVRDSGQRVKLLSGRSAIVWTAF